MSNSIDKNNLKVDNAISDFIFFWQAIFNDSSIINQFDKDGAGHLFREVKDRFTDLVYFNLTDKKGKLFTVNLLEGIIGFNDLIIPYRKSEIKKENIRLIYFRKVTRTFGLEDLKQQKIEITYNLGYQYLNSQGHNHKIVLKIDSEGNWILEG